MSAYAIALVTVHDPAHWSTYAGSVGATLAPYGAKRVLKGKVAQTLSGTNDAQACAVLEFPDIESARAWYASDAYQALIPTRDRGGSVTLSLIEVP